jgi:hypothetical protein
MPVANPGWSNIASSLWRLRNPHTCFGKIRWWPFDCARSSGLSALVIHSLNVREQFASAVAISDMLDFRDVLQRIADFLVTDLPCMRFAIAEIPRIGKVFIKLGNQSSKKQSMRVC